jgi:hypothetical protein
MIEAADSIFKDDNLIAVATRRLEAARLLT